MKRALALLVTLCGLAAAQATISPFQIRGTALTDVTGLPLWLTASKSGSTITFSADLSKFPLFLVSSGNPFTTSAVNGSTYFDTTSKLLYLRTGGSWVSQGSLQGPAGAAGAKGDTGAAGPAPVLSIGDVTSGGLANAEITGSNPYFLNLNLPIGPQGPQGNPGLNGATWRQGGTPPNNAVGQNGDFWLDTSTSNVYQKTSGSYGIVLNIRGSTGAQGAKGDQGIQGVQGVQGPKGDTGATGAAGPANALSIGTVTTVSPYASAQASITGTAPNQTLNLLIPSGMPGQDGANGGGAPVLPVNLSAQASVRYAVLGTISGTTKDRAEVTIIGGTSSIEGRKDEIDARASVAGTLNVYSRWLRFDDPYSSDALYLMIGQSNADASQGIVYLMTKASTAAVATVQAQLTLNGVVTPVTSLTWTTTAPATSVGRFYTNNPVAGGLPPTLYVKGSSIEVSGVPRTVPNGGTTGDVLTRGDSNTLLWQTPGVVPNSPSAYGLSAWTDDPAVLTSTYTPNSTTVNFMLAVATKQMNGTCNVAYNIATAGASLTAGQNLIGLYSYSAGNGLQRIAVSSDQSSNWTTAGTKTLALSGCYVNPGAVLYVAFLTVGGQRPTFTAPASATLVNVGPIMRRAQMAGQTALNFQYSTASLTAAAFAIGAVLY